MSDGETWSRAAVAERAAGSGQRPVVFIIDNDVYDVTPFLDEHPGGHEVLQNVAGRDASEDFADVGHSVDAKEMMKKYRVGSVAAAERRDPVKKQARWDEPPTQDDASSLFASWKLPLLIALLATLLYYFLMN